jgi:hypothetical protein
MTPHQTSVVRRLKLSTDARLRQRFMVIDEPVKANIRVGLLLELLDKLAEDTALRYAHNVYPNVRVVTAPWTISRSGTLRTSTKTSSSKRESIW